MTKKHFEVIAETLRNELANASALSDEARAAVIRTVEALARDFSEFNPNFNKQRFYGACGLCGV